MADTGGYGKNNREKYVVLNTDNTIKGFYIKTPNSTLPSTAKLVQFDDYNNYFNNDIPNKDTYTVDPIDDTKFNSINKLDDANITLSNYKTLKCAKALYYFRQLLSKPIEFEGNYYDMFYLRNNYFDARLVEQLSNNKEDNINLITINCEKVIMTAEKFIRFYNSYIRYIKNILDQQATMMAQIKNATTKEEVDDIYINLDVSNIYPSGSIFMPVYDNANTYVDFIDAPNDGKVYGRQNNMWVEMENDVKTPVLITYRDSEYKLENLSNKVEEANSDGKLYARKNTKWQTFENEWRID